MSEANYFVNMLYIFVSVFMCVSMYMPHMLYIVFLVTVSQFFMNALDTNWLWQHFLSASVVLSDFFFPVTISVLATLKLQLIPQSRRCALKHNRSLLQGCEMIQIQMWGDVKIKLMRAATRTSLLRVFLMFFPHRFSSARLILPRWPPGWLITAAFSR